MRALRLLLTPLAAALTLSIALSSGAMAGRQPIALGLTISPEWGTSSAWWTEELDTLGGRTPSIMSMVFAWTGPRATAPSQTSLDVFVYQPTGFPARQVLDRIYNRGAMPLLMWQPNLPEGETLQTILNGRYDRYIQTWAEAAAADGRPMILRFAQEMNAGWFPWGATRRGNSPEDFVRVWQKVHDTFRGPGGAGATNVKFMWSPNVDGPRLASFESVYPGNGYVQYIGLDGYNWYDHYSDTGEWRSMRAIFSDSLDQIAARWPNKPIVIAETGSINDHVTDGYDKGRWLQRGLRWLYENQPKVVAVVYFNIRVIGMEGGVNWRLDTSGSATSAWRELSNDPRFMGVLDPAGLAAARTRK